MTMTALHRRSNSWPYTHSIAARTRASARVWLRGVTTAWRNMLPWVSWHNRPYTSSLVTDCSHRAAIPTQKYCAVAASSVLRGEMEPEAEDAAPRNLHYAALSFLAHISSNSQTWPLELWQTFVSGALGAPIPILVNHPARSAPAASTAQHRCHARSCPVLSIYNRPVPSHFIENCPLLICNERRSSSRGRGLGQDRS
jgi:hypothetical protein